MKRSLAQQSVPANIKLMMAIEFLSEFRPYYAVQVLVYQALTGSFTLAMSVFSITQLSSALFEIPTGLMSDKIGRRKTYIVGLCAEFLSVVCLTLSFSANHPLLMLYLGSLSLGLAVSLFSGNNEALAYESMASSNQDEDLPHALGKIRAAGQAALCTASLLASALLWLDFSFYQLAALTLFPMGLALLLTFFITEPPRLDRHEKSEWTRLKEALTLVMTDKKIRGLALASILREGAGHASHSFLPAFVNTVWPLWLTSFYRVGQNLIGIFSFWFAGKIIKRTSPLQSLLASATYSNIVSLLAYTLKNAASPILVMSTQFFYALRITANSTIQQQTFSNDHRATMGSLVSFGCALMTALTSLLMGSIADSLSPATALLTLLIISSPSGLIYLNLFKRQRRQKTNDAPASDKEAQSIDKTPSKQA